ncbi:MAG: hypothetical protein K2F74_04205 [Muribaculaceae bacterium]|nr:hypothetical protein [Muribaculaceae bacterium]
MKNFSVALLFAVLVSCGFTACSNGHSKADYDALISKVEKDQSYESLTSDDYDMILDYLDENLKDAVKAEKNGDESKEMMDCATLMFAVSAAEYDGKLSKEQQKRLEGFQKEIEKQLSGMM